MIEEYELNIEKINDKLQRFIPIKVPKNYSIMDIKNILDQNFGLKIQYQILFHRDHQLNDRDKISTIFEKSNQDKKKKFDIQLLYNYDSDEEIINQANKNYSKGNNTSKDELDIKTFLIKQETNEENPNENFNSYKVYCNNNVNYGNPTNSKNEEKFINRKRERNYSNTNNTNNNKRQFNSDYNLWNNNRKTSKGMFSNNMKIYYGENQSNINPYEDDIIMADDYFNDLAKLKTILDFDKEYFVMPKKTFDESQYDIRITKRKEFNIDKAYKEEKTKKLYELCFKFINDGYANLDKIPQIIFETSAKDDKARQPFKSGIDDIYSKIDEIDEFIFNVEDLVDRLHKSKLQNEEKFEDKSLNEINVNINGEDTVNMIIEELKEDQLIQDEKKKITFEELPIQNENIINQQEEENQTSLKNLNMLNEEISIEEPSVVLSVSKISSKNKIIQEEENRLIQKDNFSNRSNQKQKYGINNKSVIHNKSILQEKNNLCPLNDERDASFKDMRFNRSFQSENYERNMYKNSLSSKPVFSPGFGREEIILQFEFLYSNLIKRSLTIQEFTKQLKIFYKSIDNIKIDENFISMNQKINIILDLDNTLINGRSDNKSYCVVPQNIKPIFQSELNMANTNWYVTVTLRPYTKEFLQKLKKFSSFYINTHGLKAYGKYVSEILETECKIKIPESNIKGRENDCKSLKQFSNYSDSFLRHSIILDDTPFVWTKDKLSHNVVLNSMKYISFIEKKRPSQLELKELKNELSRYCLKMVNFKGDSSISSNLSGLELDDEYYIPLFAEYNHSNKFQLEYLGYAIEKIYKIVTITKCDTMQAINLLKSTILIGIGFNLDYCMLKEEALKIIKNLIENMGGFLRDKQNATHFLVSKNKVNLLKENMRENWRIQHKLNLKFLFHSYFFIDKMNEQDLEYTELF